MTGNSSESMADNKKSKSESGAFNSVWNTFKSMRFALILLLIIAAASIFNLFAGEFIIPVRSDYSMARAVYQQAYGDFRVDLLMALQMYSPYSSWWFLALLILLSLSLLVCAIERAPIVFRQVFKPIFIREMSSYLNSQPNARLSGKSLVEGVENVFRSSGYRVKKEESSENTLIVGDKVWWARSGSWFVHIGFILLIMGSAIIARGSYISQAQGKPGELLALDESRWGFNVRVDDFIIEYYPLDVDQWISLDDFILGRISKKNDDGTFDVEIFRPRHDHFEHIASERISNRIDFQAESGRLDQANISDYIAVLTVIENGKEVRTERIEVNRPLRYRGYRFYQSSFDDTNTDEQGRWTTILTVRKDQGSPLVWAGILLVSLGLTAGMYFVPRRINALIKPGNNGQEAFLTGSSVRSASLFGEEFASVIKKLRKDLNQTENKK